MNKKINYRWTERYDPARPNCGCNSETDYIVTDGVYDFEDWLSDHGVSYEKNNDVFFATDHGERTGEAYIIISEENTNEELQA